MALSGGGARSANFSAACILQLERLGLMRHVDYLSPVSGGSLTAAYYCAAADGLWKPGNIQTNLSDSFGTDMLVQTLLPWNLAAFAFSDWGRGDVLAGVFTRKLFHSGDRPLTYADLLDRPPAPADQRHRSADRPAIRLLQRGVRRVELRFSAAISSQSVLGFFGSIATSLGLSSQNFVARANSATLAETIISNGTDLETAADIRAKIHQLDTDGFVQFSDQNGSPVRVIYIVLSQLDSLSNLPFDDFSQIVNHIDTSYDISPAQVFFLYKAAQLLVKGKQEENVRAIVQGIETGGNVPVGH
jgi:hypothetical protein